MKVQPVPDTARSATPTGAPVSDSGAVGQLDLPKTGELRVDEALAAVSELTSGTSAEATKTLGDVLQRLEQILSESQDAKSQ